MTSFIHLDYATEHPGVARAESILGSMAHLKQSFKRSFGAARSLASVLLAALVAALVVVADLMIDTWAEGHLLAAWVALWVVAFSAMALFAPAAKNAAAALTLRLKDWQVQSAQQRSEELYWQSAQRDPRVMADLQAAITRAENEGVKEPAKAVAAYFAQEPAVDAISAQRQHLRRHMGGSYLRNF